MILGLRRSDASPPPRLSFDEIQDVQILENLLWNGALIRIILILLVLQCSQNELNELTKHDDIKERK